MIPLALLLFASFAHSAFAFRTGESASLVLGQSSFTSKMCSTTQSGFCFTSGSAFDSSGNLWIADEVNDRVLEFNPPFSNDENASLVIGQSGFTTDTCSVTRSGLCSPVGLAFDPSGNLWVADQRNNRTLEFATPFSSGESASIVLGQSSFTVGTCNLSGLGSPPTPSTLCIPVGVAFDSSGNLWVTDRGNNRILEFNPPFSNDESASLVLGQSSLTANGCSGGFTGLPPSQNGLCLPVGLGFDSSGNLWVADQYNNRVLEFDAPFSDGEAAALVIGQPGFATSTCNLSGLGSPPTQGSLCRATGLAFGSSGNLWVADQVNSRVLEFNPPFSNGENASLVIGQSSFTTNTCSVTQSGLCRPLGLTFDSKSNLWVPDGFNSRVLAFARHHRIKS